MGIATALLQLATVLLAAKVAGFLFDRIGQPKVLGELIAGLVIGPSVLHWLDPHNEITLFIAEIGIIMLLFEVGIESNVHDLLKSGLNAFVVAIIGVAAPILLVLPYLVGTGMDSTTAFFIAATLTATSVGLTMRVLGDMKKLDSLEGRVILGAAVIDDILGLILLSVLSDMVETGGIVPFNVAKVVVLALAFLVLAVVLGKVFEKRILAWVHRLKVDRTFIVTAFVFAIVMSYLAAGIGLATIVGAFAAGLILEREEHKEHIFHKTHVLTQVFAPVFFVVAGAGVDLGALFKPELWGLLVVLSVIALAGKLVAGLGAWNLKASKLAIGIGMVPRGEVGLIFASFGLAHGLVNNELYSVLVFVIMLTTFVTPPALKMVLEKKDGSKTPDAVFEKESSQPKPFSRVKKPVKKRAA